MKKLILTILLASMSAQAEQVNWRNLYHAIAHNESTSGKFRVSKDGKRFGILHIGQSCLDDINQRILKGKLKRKITMADIYDWRIVRDAKKGDKKAIKALRQQDENSYRIMYWYTTYYARKYQERTGHALSYLTLSSVHRWGYVGLKRRGRFNRYAIAVRNYASDLDWSDKQDKLFARVK